MLQLLGIISGILSGGSYLPYIRDIFKGTTKPERASWFIWATLGVIAFFSQLAEGASWSLWFTALDTLGVFLIFTLSFKYGVGGFNRRDVFALMAAGVGLILWYLTRHAFIALFITMFIDATGAVLTVLKAYEDPGSETLSMWVIIAFAAILAMASVGTFNPVLLAYPFYIFLANAAVVIAILFGRVKKI